MFGRYHTIIDYFVAGWLVAVAIIFVVYYTASWWFGPKRRKDDWMD